MKYNPIKYRWEDYSAAVECDCGRELIISDEQVTCVCGSTYVPYYGVRLQESLKKELIPTDIEILGYKHVRINQPVTDTRMSSDSTNWCVKRIQLDMTDYLVLDLGNGREIRIKFHANRSDL